MNTKKFNGEINGKPVKVIVVDKGWKKMWFAKPKDFDVDTPHFEQKVNGTLQAHMDSADGNSVRVMSVAAIYSGSFQTGSTFAQNTGRDIMLLPMNPSASGFAIDTSLSGSYVKMSKDDEWCLMAVGSLSPWQAKK